MSILDVIAHKRDGQSLTQAEIDFFVSGIAAGDVPDYQAAALLMAIYLRGLNDDEIVWLTEAMMRSGDVVDLSTLPGVKVDKHSTGGVGDTTSVILIPLVSSAGATIAKMSGRGLGHTGGTIDKLETIPGFRVGFTVDELIGLTHRTGCAIVEQTTRLVPADKQIYALRDVTGTTSSVGLIASSVMSKKLAAGADRILLDVKTGSGAFITDWEMSVKLASTMVRIGESFGRETVAILTNMDQPLGNRIGNALEIEAAVRVLKGEPEGDLRELCLYLGAELLILAEIARSNEEGQRILAERIESGAALDQFRQMIEAQGGDGRVVDDPDGLLPHAQAQAEIRAPDEGYLQRIETGSLGDYLVKMGVGRSVKGQPVDPAVGVWLRKRCGDAVRQGDALGVVYGHDDVSSRAHAEAIARFFHVGPKPPDCPPLIRARIDRDGLQSTGLS